jgi:hypothetical protein
MYRAHPSVLPLQRTGTHLVEKRGTLPRLIHPHHSRRGPPSGSPGIRPPPPRLHLHLSFRTSPSAIVHGSYRSLLCPLQSPRRSRSRQPSLAAAPQQPPPLQGSPIETTRPTTMAFASSLLPVPPSRVCATPASEVAAFSPAKKSVSLAAPRQRRGSRHGGNPCLRCPNTLSLSSHFLSAPALCACPRPALV